MAKFKLEVEDTDDEGMKVDFQIDDIGCADLSKNTATQNLAIMLLDKLDRAGINISNIVKK